MTIQVSNKGFKAVVFHWTIGYFDMNSLASGEVSFSNMVDEMMMLDMQDLVHTNHTSVYRAYKDAVNFAKGFVGEQ